MTPAEERIIVELLALPPSDRLPDGMPTPEALDRVTKTLSQAEVREIARKEIYRVTEIYLELLATIGAAKRVPDDTGEVHYKKLRDITKVEDDAIGVLIDAALQGPEAVAVEA